MKIMVPIVRGLDVSNFLKDILRVPKFVIRWRMTSKHFSRVPK